MDTQAFHHFHKIFAPQTLRASFHGRLILTVLTLTLMTLTGLPFEAVGLAPDPCQDNPSQPCQENRAVEDVVQAFDNLTHHGEWMGFRQHSEFPVRNLLNGKEAHIQGIARSQHKGKPYLFVSSAGNWLEIDGTAFDKYSDSNLMVIEMGSRDETGERLRSNRLARGKGTDCTPPHADDRVVTNINFPGYNHPGSLAMVGNILAVPFEQPALPFDKSVKYCNPAKDSCDDRMPDGKISFFDVSAPTKPNWIFDLVPVAKLGDPESPSRLAPQPTKDKEVLITHKGFGVVGLTRLPDEHFLLVTGAGNGSKVEFWRSNSTSFFDEAGEPDKSFAFDLHGTLYKDHDEEPDSPGMGDWFVSDGTIFLKFGLWHTYQSYSFVNQSDDNLYLIVGRNVNPLAPSFPGEDRIALYKVGGFSDGADISLTNLSEEAA